MTADTTLDDHGTPSRLLVIGIILAAVLFPIVSAIPIAGAQEIPTETTSAGDGENNTSATTTESHWVGTGGNNSSEGGGWLGGGSIIPDMPGPWEWASGVIEGFIEDFVDGVASFIDKFNSIFFGVPAPGEATDINTWTNPSDGNWGGVWDMYWLNASLMFAFLVVANMWSFSNQDRAAQRELFRNSIKGTFHLLVGFIYLAMLLHFGDVMALSFAPSGDELLSTPGNVAKLGMGIVIGGSFILFKSGAVAIAVLVVILFYFIVHLLVAFWPWFITFRVLPLPAFGSVGSLGITALPGIVIIRVFQAAILQFLHLMTWDVTEGGAFLMALLGTALGLLVAFIGLPVIGYKKVLPSAMMMTNPVKTKADKVGELGRGKMRDKAQEEYGRYRSGSTPTTKKEPSPSRANGPALGERPLPTENDDGTTVWTHRDSDAAGSQPSTPTTKKRPATDGGPPSKWDFRQKQDAKDILSDYEHDTNGK